MSNKPWISLTIRPSLARLLIVIASIQLSSCGEAGGNEEASSRPPNFVVIFTDDQGYGDLSCFGATHVHTPRIDQMAVEGAKLTSFYVAAPLCSPSRAALMTGSYPRRVGLATGSRFMVLLSDDEWGIHPDERTIPEILKERGYRTGIFGKWHLGDQPEFLPTRHGFDEFYGLPYSHDIHPHHPRQDFFQFPPLPLYENEKVVALDPSADSLTFHITNRAVDFIERHKEQPFFLYVPHPLPHTPLHVLPSSMETVPDSVRVQLAQEAGTVHYDVRRNLFPQAIAEIDWSVGQILDALRARGLEENTLVLFTTDNGAAIGKSDPLRGKKGSTYEGGMRVPAIVRWPGKIPPGQVLDELLTSMDILPSFAHLAGASLPEDRVLDGRNIWPILNGTQQGPVHDRFFYHGGNELRAVRSGKWKLHRATADKGVELYNLEEDIAEKHNLANDHPDIIERLEKMMEEFDREMSDSSMVRPQGIGVIRKGGGVSRQ